MNKNVLSSLSCHHLLLYSHRAFIARSHVLSFRTTRGILNDYNSASCQDSSQASLREAVQNDIGIASRPTDSKKNSFSSKPRAEKSVIARPEGASVPFRGKQSYIRQDCHVALLLAMTKTVIAHPELVEGLRDLKENYTYI